MGKTYDISKLRKGLTKSISGIGTGFHNPDVWLNTGCYVLNYIISADFNRGVPLDKITMFAGSSGCLPETAIVKTPEKTISIKELKELVKSGKKVEILTPSGYSEITEWFDKGLMKLYRITTKNHSVDCAYNHLIKAVSFKDGFEWKPASQLTTSDSIYTESGIEDITSVEELEEAECYDFTVNNEEHNFYSNGIESHNSGKSYITSGNLVKDALSKGVIVCLIDSEDALTEEWMNNLGVDTNNENLIRVQTNSIEKVMQTVTEMTNWYSETFAETPREEQPGMYFVIDSLGALFPEDETKRFDEGELSMTDGMRNAGAKTKLMNHLINKTAGQKMGAAITNHVYASTELYSPDKIGGGNKAIFLSSIIVQMEKLMLKEDEQGNKTTEILGIRASCNAIKTRWNKPFEKVQVQIPYTTGMNPYSGLFDFFESRKLLERNGNKYMYKSLADGHEMFNEFRKNYTSEMYEEMMKDFTENYNKKALMEAVEESK